MASQAVNTDISPYIILMNVLAGSCLFTHLADTEQHLSAIVLLLHARFFAMFTSYLILLSTIFRHCMC